MQQFPCPWCGKRAEMEFRYAGDAGVKRPERSADDKTWAQYLHFRKNAKGSAKELWIHAAGCGRSERTQHRGTSPDKRHHSY